MLKFWLLNFSNFFHQRTICLSSSTPEWESWKGVRYKWLLTDSSSKSLIYAERFKTRIYQDFFFFPLHSSLCKCCVLYLLTNEGVKKKFQKMMTMMICIFVQSRTCLNKCHGDRWQLILVTYDRCDKKNREVSINTDVSTKMQAPIGWGIIFRVASCTI